MTRAFTEFLADKLGTQDWCVAGRLTDRMRRKGYDLAVSQRRYRELEIEWERETYGAPLESLEKAAPDLLLVVREFVNADFSALDDKARVCLANWRAHFCAAIAKAERAP